MFKIINKHNGCVPYSPLINVILESNMFSLVASISSLKFSAFEWWRAVDCLSINVLDRYIPFYGIHLLVWHVMCFFSCTALLLAILSFTYSSIRRRLITAWIVVHLLNTVHLKCVVHTIHQHGTESRSVGFCFVRTALVFQMIIAGGVAAVAVRFCLLSFFFRCSAYFTRIVMPMSGFVVF